MNCIKLHHVILHYKAELNHLMTGVQALGLLEEIQHNPQLFEPCLWLQNRVPYQQVSILHC